ncbi:1-acyl-sn-glycerol-3-phosphate acyltransferase [Luteitalea sp. TBR-22]|uniref:lysophospholipid acyltransferase family protein n=1 Tax=Luteitalea sp. TBR-22 TaxID=2802971 RepID=UPI001AFB4B63|nr:lysophospholipid acyltransferase family protein [Luteitalea sp. TBR-22]BCS34636.1 1-acyl-sn-glycerol-3-phosphate acyltransferase [Luteitalea sp. TBR-22]
MRVPPFHWWRTVFYLIPAIALYTIVLGTLSLLSVLVDRQGHLAHGCARAWAWLILKTTRVTVDISGLDTLPRDRPFLFLANHQSIYDIPVIFWHVPYQLRILAKASLGRFPFLGWHLSRTGHVLVDRSNPGNSTMLQIKELMRQRVSLIVFPEGTRSADGRVARFRGGIVMLAIEAGLPIVPVAIEGTRHVMLKGRLMTCPGHVRVRVLPVVPTEGLEVGEARKLAGVVERQVREAVEALQQGGA